jgi:hypothetical protein
MKFNLREKFDNFLNNTKDYPLLVGFVSGFYPMVFYYSNNFESKNSCHQLLFFSFLFLLIPTFGTYLLYVIFNYFPKLNSYKKHLLFVLIIELTGIYFSQVYFLSIKKKILLLVLILAIYLSIRLYDSYKKILVFICFLSIIPFFQCVYIVLYKQFNDTLSWTKLNDKIEDVKFIIKPNVYYIEPDGYVGKEAMQKFPYQYNDTLYDWLKSKSFTLYKNFHSNYPSSLASNGTMFSMKHSDRDQSPSVFMMQDMRSIICGNNPVVSIFKNNNYKTFFIVENAYFLENFRFNNYDYYNIKKSQVPYFLFDKIKKDVYVDLKECIEKNINKKKSLFFFVERLLPHHINFYGGGKDFQRNEYLKKIEDSNVWIMKSINLIEKYDPNAIIIINSDHGGWVGLESMEDILSTKDFNLNESTYNNLLAIKWNDSNHKEYDKKLKTNVNIFRVLFSYLSEDITFLKYLEDDTIHKIDL